MTRTGAICGLGLIMLVTSPAMAAKHHRHHATPAAAVAAAPPRPTRAPYSFYPENIEGGVPGNLPFNNQIRKHTDPLNANGGR